MAFKRTNTKSLINTNGRKKPIKNNELDNYFRYLVGKFDNSELRELTKDLKKLGETAQRIGKIKVALAVYMQGKITGAKNQKAIEFLNSENQQIVFEVLEDFVFMW